MALKIPPLQDVVRLTGSDVAKTADNYRRHLESAGPVWSYDPAKRQARAVFSLEMPREAAVKACGQKGHKGGRPFNEEVGGLIWDAANERGKFMCHPIKSRMLNLRSDIQIKVDPQFLFVETGKPVFFYLQPRKSHVPGALGLRVIATAIHSLFAIDDAADADLMLLDLSQPEQCDVRAMASYNFADLPLLSAAEMEGFFQRFVDAYDLVSAEGIRPKPKRPRPEKERGDDLFGPPPPA